MTGAMDLQPASCPACHSPAIRHLGALPERKGLIALATPGNLYRCEQCQLRFRHPYPEDAEVVSAYAKCPAHTWENPRRRADFALAAEFLTSNLSHGNVLDVGCSHGDFLAGCLPARFCKFGVEPSRDARLNAESRGIRIVADTLANIPQPSAAFDAICLMDCIEHLRNPLDAVSRLASFLAPGGYLLISTGNADYPLWKLMGTDYYYFYNEHVSFLTKAWFQWAARSLALALIETRTFSHHSAGFILQAKQLSACALRLAQRYLGRPDRLPRLARRYPFSLCSRVQGFGLTGVPDHFLVILRAPQFSLGAGDTSTRCLTAALAKEGPPLCNR